MTELVKVYRCKKCSLVYPVATNVNSPLGFICEPCRGDHSKPHGEAYNNDAHCIANIDDFWGGEA